MIQQICEEWNFSFCQIEAKHEQIISIPTFCRLPRLVKRKMATLDDKLLGEKLHYYCSSSEDEGEEEEETGVRGGSSSVAPSRDWDGSSANTGPKGVIKDWQRYKQLETEKR